MANMDGLFRLVVDDSPDLADLALLEEHVAAAAAEAVGAGEAQEFGVFARADDGRVLAGVSGLVWGGYCELHAMWVDETLRGRGLARQMMEQAEGHARRKGCSLVLFHAYDALARGLYARLGYDVVGIVEDCPSGSTARWYRKNL